MSKIQALFADLHRTGKKGLIPFITAGDPGLDSRVDACFSAGWCEFN